MEKLKIGWIGSGVMGNAMCGHLLAAGHRISLFNRTRSKAEGLVDKGAQWCESPLAVARASDIVFSMVGFPTDVGQVLLSDQGVLAGAKPGMVIVDMTTSSPDLARKVYSAAKELGVSALDAPVSGGDIGAREATLAIMVGGGKATYEQILPLFQILGKNIAHMGAAGAGQHTKMCNQILIAGTMIGTVEALLYAHRMGMDQNAVIDVIGQGAGSEGIFGWPRKISLKSIGAPKARVDRPEISGHYPLASYLGSTARSSRSRLKCNR